MHTAYVKSPQLKAIIDQEGISCEEKLERITKLAEGKKLSLLPSGQAPEVISNEPINQQVEVTNQPSVEQLNEPSGNPEHFSKILAEIQGVKEKQLAEVILQEIEKSSYISYDLNSWEILISNEKIKFTNLIHLIKFVVSAKPSSLPLASTLFLHALLQIKTPFEVIRNGDAIQCRDNLLKIEEFSKTESKEVIENETSGLVENVNNESETMENSGEVNIEETTEEKRSKRKRSREIADEDNVNEEPQTKRSFGVEDKALQGLRRSPRLRKNIADVWSSNKSGAKKKGKKNGKS